MFSCELIELVSSCRWLLSVRIRRFAVDRGLSPVGTRLATIDGRLHHHSLTGRGFVGDEDAAGDAETRDDDDHHDGDDPDHRQRFHGILQVGVDGAEFYRAVLRAGAE